MGIHREKEASYLIGEKDTSAQISAPGKSRAACVAFTTTGAKGKEDQMPVISIVQLRKEGSDAGRSLIKTENRTGPRTHSSQKPG